MPYIVEKDYVKGTYLTENPAALATTIYVASIANLLPTSLVPPVHTGIANIYDDNNSEQITISAVGTHATRGPYITISAPALGLANAYTGRFAGNLYQDTLETSERVEFDMRIGYRWCKLAQIKIVQRIAGAMDISFEIWEETPILEGVRAEMHKNVLRRNITLAADQGGWYGESLVNNLLLYMDRNDPGDEREYNLHCALVNEAAGTISDFSVTVKIAEIGELV